MHLILIDYNLCFVRTLTIHWCVHWPYIGAYIDHTLVRTLTYIGPCNTVVILLHFLRTWVLKVLLWTSHARLLPLSLIWLYSTMPLSNLWLSSLLECSLQLSGGIITTATFTLMMLSSQNSSSGTKASHSALLATVEVLGKLFMISSSGFLVDIVGYPCFFGFCLFLALLFIPVLRNGKFSSSKRSQWSWLKTIIQNVNFYILNVQGNNALLSWEIVASWLHNPAVDYSKCSN